MCAESCVFIMCVRVCCVHYAHALTQHTQHSADYIAHDNIVHLRVHSTVNDDTDNVKTQHALRAHTAHSTL
jgi:hypothetical protein